MKKPKDIADIASRLASAATAPLVAATSIAVLPKEEEEPVIATPAPSKPSAAPRKTSRKPPNRNTVGIFLRMPGHLYEKYDEAAVRRTKATGRGVTVQQVIVDLLQKENPA